MKKEDLIKLLKEARDTEENAVPIYLGHLSSAIFWAGISKEKAEEARAILRTLASESDGHKKVVLQLLKKVTEAKKDVI